MTTTKGETMTDRVLGVGATCCGNDCGLCAPKKKPAPAPAPVDKEDDE